MYVITMKLTRNLACYGWCERFLKKRIPRCWWAYVMLDVKELATLERI